MWAAAAVTLFDGRSVFVTLSVTAAIPEPVSRCDVGTPVGGKDQRCHHVSLTVEILRLGGLEKKNLKKGQILLRGRLWVVQLPVNLDSLNWEQVS